ncbi:MAG: TonB-dependent receptor [Deltaproteobacteria bacterium]|nr:TonB-dependent receptor [Deltaproteobacteria bacterium]
MRIRSALLLGFLILVIPRWSVAHGGVAPGLVGDPSNPASGAKVTLDGAGRLLAVEEDSNADGVPDLWNRYEAGRLARQERDLNGDGRLDYWLYVEPATGKPFRGEMDGDFDGRADTDEEYRDGSVVRQRVDTNHDGLYDAAYHGYAGSLTLIEQDTDLDGRFDRWTYFEASRSSITVLDDRDRDGFPEHRVRVVAGEVVEDSDRTPPPATENAVAEPDVPDGALEEVEVRARRATSAAGDYSVRDRDFRSFPHANPSDLVRLVPGIHVSQHTGGAKAYQYFLRGFDAEHGQDLAAYFDGVPLNESSQVHGHGYLDLHFLIPETVAAMRIVKGPYDPEFGNFATAGAVVFVPRRSSEHREISTTAGMFGTARVYAGGGVLADPYIAHIAAETDHTEGTTDPGFADAARGFGSHTWLPGSTTLNLTSAHYGQRSAAADVIPAKWVDDGRIGRFDGMDASDRVTSNRHLVSATLDHDAGNQSIRAQGYFDYKRSAIFSNYTFYLLNPTLGDQQEMRDNRDTAGMNLRYMREDKAGTLRFISSAGAQWKLADVDQVLANTTERVRFNVINDLRFTENEIGVWVKEEARLARWLTLVPGARFDAIAYAGDGTQDERFFNIYTNLADTRQDVPRDWNETASIVSPKISTIFAPVPDWNIYVNYGEGFFSNTSLQMANDPEPTIPKVRGGEIGSRVWAWGDRFTIAGSGWFANKETDLVFDPQTGITSTKAETERRGVDGEVRLSPWKPLYLATDAAYVDARFADTGERIPNGPIFLMTNGIGVSDLAGWRGMIRGRYMGERELDQGDFADPYYVTDVVVGYDAKTWGAELAIDNVFDVEWEDAVFSYETRPEPNGETVNGIHYTAGTPFFARATVTARF